MTLWKLSVSVMPLPFHFTNSCPVLEQAPGRDKKRRATDFLFKRLRADELGDVPQVSTLAGKISLVRQEKQRSASQSDNSGIPPIRTTLPGDEVNDMKALKAAINSRVKGAGTLGLSKDIGCHRLYPQERAAPSETTSIKAPQNARRFHLSRERELLAPSKLKGGVRKSVHLPKTPLATFVEKRLAREAQISSKVPPIDRILEFKTSDVLDKTAKNASNPAEFRNQVVTKNTLDQPFVKPAANGAKTGHTINTHPATWDFDSDQLASELAAFAFELDPTGDIESAPLHSKMDLGVAEAESASEDEYVYETYIRLPHNAALQTEIEQNNLTANIGVLVIAEEDEELWEAYAESDSDNEWDEEDADSNGRFASSSK